MECIIFIIVCYIAYSIGRSDRIPDDEGSIPGGYIRPSNKKTTQAPPPPPIPRNKT